MSGCVLMCSDLLKMLLQIFYKYNYIVNIYILYIYICMNSVHMYCLYYLVTSYAIFNHFNAILPFYIDNRYQRTYFI